MEPFYNTHNYLLDNMEPNLYRRYLMDKIDWTHRLIGIKGSRGVGKTTLLLQYAKEHYRENDRRCLYINLNHFYFTECSLSNFCNNFIEQGGETLLLDQVFKYPNWSQELRKCYDLFPTLKVVFTGSSVMKLKKTNPYIGNITHSYNLQGFSFREYLGVMTQSEFPAYPVEEIFDNYPTLIRDIEKDIAIEPHFSNYIHHGYYPFFLEKRNYSENLLKTINMMMEVDILYIKEIEQSYLSKIRRLFYLLAIQSPAKPNISQLSVECEISRATVMNYLKYLQDARLINMLYNEKNSFPKKPERVYLNNTNIIYPTKQTNIDKITLSETFLLNQLYDSDRIKISDRDGCFEMNDEYLFSIQNTEKDGEDYQSCYVVMQSKRGKQKKRIPLWLFGLLY